MPEWVCGGSKINDDAVCSLGRLIGDQQKAEKRIRELSSLVVTIEGEDPDGTVEVLKAVADPCRLRIIKLLKEGELCVCEIMAALDRRQSSTSHHLSVLKEAGLVRERKDGKWSYYRIADGAVMEMLKQAEVLKKK
ncbi:metalloregulator ArsR/SmtB family transcription factor [Methanotrichaceae archaeon M04Ac]|jgi:ArsR family transcriptional regulator|uniref:Metalloregulator ArsR/SmtB family transcription factor n=1 Tax=Candidatus Methanocrinis alkalitolerans TaxID=3033395 RepID=A0ABT5XGW5_9EURY|nr:metalloregulator ArsR/SmtB family transcription factor [Candidatus Methanocrinis alkalitolerans]MCR3883642.1 metalloregulator ArsR/SmtB family transcription factor [Methanothrix sp.]MDF0593963.1 metalloregulator ArsR/SmtB family transcription factor [Candidatus Methanocrinis alkalitolerans]